MTISDNEEKACFQGFRASSDSPPTAKTEADGLACASPSGFVTRIMTNLVSGEFTVSDAKLFDYLRMLDKTESIRIEP